MNRPVRTDEARLVLTEIPFLRLRDHLPEPSAGLALRHNRKEGRSGPKGQDRDPDLPPGDMAVDRVVTTFAARLGREAGITRITAVAGRRVPLGAFARVPYQEQDPRDTSGMH